MYVSVENLYCVHLFRFEEGNEHNVMYFLKVSIYLNIISHCLHCDPQPSGSERFSACEHFGPAGRLHHEDAVRTLQPAHHLPVSLLWLLLAFTRLDLFVLAFTLVSV